MLHQHLVLLVKITALLNIFCVYYVIPLFYQSHSSKVKSNLFYVRYDLMHVEYCRIFHSMILSQQVSLIFYLVHKFFFHL